MTKIIVFGNSGSGKSTLAKRLVADKGLSHLDLDTIAWKPSLPPERMHIDESKRLIDDFLSSNSNWVIEGCYADLLELVAKEAEQAIFLNLPIEACISNAKSRPWEPHKYESKAAQDANLTMLIDWIAQYDSRQDTFSKRAHEQLFKQFHGIKTMLTENSVKA